MSTEDFRLPFALPLPIHLRISHADLDFIKIIFEILSCFLILFLFFYLLDILSTHFFLILILG